MWPHPVPLRLVVPSLPQPVASSDVCSPSEESPVCPLVSPQPARASTDKTSALRRLSVQVSYIRQGKNSVRHNYSLCLLSKTKKRGKKSRKQLTIRHFSKMVDCVLLRHIGYPEPRGVFHKERITRRHDELPFQYFQCGKFVRHADVLTVSMFKIQTFNSLRSSHLVQLCGKYQTHTRVMLRRHERHRPSVP